MTRVSMEMVPLATFTLRMEPPLVIPGTPAGTRVIVEFPEIEVTGRLRARRHGAAAADWLVVGPEGTATLDLRFCLETDDGARIYVHGGGSTDSAGFASGAAPVWFTPRFETADPRYAWLHRAMVVCRGIASADRVTFEAVELR